MILKLFVSFLHLFGMRLLESSDCLLASIVNYNAQQNNKAKHSNYSISDVSPDPIWRRPLLFLLLGVWDGDGLRSLLSTPGTYVASLKPSP